MRLKLVLLKVNDRFCEYSIHPNKNICSSCVVISSANTAHFIETFMTHFHTFSCYTVNNESFKTHGDRTEIRLVSLGMLKQKK